MPASEDAETLAELILNEGIIPEKAITDAAHIAIASTHKIDFLLTWNCKHLANAQIIRRIKTLFDKKGYNLPLICTPYELLGEYDD